MNCQEQLWMTLLSDVSDSSDKGSGISVDPRGK